MQVNSAILKDWRHKAHNHFWVDLVCKLSFYSFRQWQTQSYPLFRKLLLQWVFFKISIDPELHENYVSYSLWVARRSGAAGFFRRPLQQPCYKKTISRLGLVCVFRIPQNPKLPNGFFRNLFIFSKKALQTIDKLFLFCLIIGIIFMR